ncbi:hypothetical protein DMH04_45040 [Kibdelosporangium aridum]|uniref:Uncharacterized protein n=1 Tax=Kibdelosporangium aridum TaxID=2030 RepID=A0A428YPS9_KIBAR|nr:hypothetical protein DMH04_45040 [Kibdelosporangium aridum]
MRSIREQLWRPWRMRVTQHRVDDIGKRLFPNCLLQADHFAVITRVVRTDPGLQNDSECVVCNLSTATKNVPIELTYFDGRLAAFGKRGIASHTQRKRQVIERVVDSWIQQKWNSAASFREGVTFEVTVAPRTGKQVVFPYKRAQRRSREWFVMIDVGSLIVTAIHAPATTTGKAFKHVLH